MQGVARIDRLRLPLRGQEQRILAFLEDEGVSRGYAGYWDAHSFTWHAWHAGAEAAAYPVIACGAPASGALCPLNLASASRWYEPRAGRSFLLVGPPGILALGPPPTVFGPPAVTRRFGPYTVHVFDYDIASRLRPAPPPEGLRSATPSRRLMSVWPAASEAGLELLHDRAARPRSMSGSSCDVSVRSGAVRPV
jgi:hypothetical protein